MTQSAKGHYMNKNIAYKWLVDEFVKISKIDVTANRIRKNGHGERTNETDLRLSTYEQQQKELLLRLSKKDQEIIASMLEQARSSAIHDVCSLLEDELALENMEIFSIKGKISASPFASMHYDFVCRHQGDAWPDE